MSNPTIDGVPREAVAALEKARDVLRAIIRDKAAGVHYASAQAACHQINGALLDELRALLDAPAKLDLFECDACPTSGGCVSVCMKAPKPAAQPQAEFDYNGWSIDHSAGRPILMHNNCSVIEAEQAYGLLELIKTAAKPQGEPVALTAVGVLRDNGEGELVALASDLHRVTAERDAALGREAELIEAAKVDALGIQFEQKRVQALQQRLNAGTKLYTEQPAPVALALPDRVQLRDIIAQAIGGDAYDCVRVWAAWGVGTMSQDDFVPVVDQEERLYEIVDACLNEVARVQPPKPTEGMPM